MSRKLVRQWTDRGTALLNKSDELYRRLSSGDVPQEDASIYSVYELSAEGSTLIRCALELKALLDKESE